MSNDKSKPRATLKSLRNSYREEIIDYLKVHGATKSNTPDLYMAIDKKSYRGLEDAFIYLEEVEGILVQEKRGRAKVWRLKDKSLLMENLSQKDLNNFTYALELNKDEFDASTIETIEKIFKSNQAFMFGYLAPYEELDNPKINEFYDTLLESIKEHFYLVLKFKHDKIERYNNVKPIQIVFIDNNWYIAFEYQNDKTKQFVFRRLAFIEHIKLLHESKYSQKNRFQKKDTKLYLDFLKKVQNAMTLYGVEKKTAIIKATHSIAKYFEKDMKKFLPSQLFKSKEEDGSIIFTLEYTQELEILPFIQKWLPDLVIVEPQELKEAYRQKLEQTIKNHLG